jgi:hypothetical protein
MCGPAATLSARSSSPRGGMCNTCGRPANFFLSFQSRHPGFVALFCTLNPWRSE